MVTIIIVLDWFIYNIANGGRLTIHQLLGIYQVLNIQKHE